MFPTKETNLTIVSFLFIEKVKLISSLYSEALCAHFIRIINVWDGVYKTAKIESSLGLLLHDLLQNISHSKRKIWLQRSQGESRVAF